MSPLARLFALPVRAYRLIFSPWVGQNCRYDPTCSAYALEALEKHGALRGGFLIDEIPHLGVDGVFGQDVMDVNVFGLARPVTAILGLQRGLR